MSKNRIMINRTAKKELVCEVMSSTMERKSKTYVISHKGRYYVRHNMLNGDVSIGVIFKAMGYESDYMIVSSSRCSLDGGCDR
jgi:DNA-directed RNA polymerase III subunit RPC2